MTTTSTTSTSIHDPRLWPRQGMWWMIICVFHMTSTYSQCPKTERNPRSRMASLMMIRGKMARDDRIVWRNDGWLLRGKWHVVVKHVENGWETLMFDDDSEEDDTWWLEHAKKCWRLSFINFWVKHCYRIIRTCMYRSSIAEIRKNFNYRRCTWNIKTTFPVRKLGKPILNLNRTLMHMFMLVIIMHVKIKDIHPNRKLQSSKNCFWILSEDSWVNW